MSSEIDIWLYLASLAAIVAGALGGGSYGIIALIRWIKADYRADLAERIERAKIDCAREIQQARDYGDAERARIERRIDRLIDHLTSTGIRFDVQGDTNIGGGVTGRDVNTLHNR